MSKRTITNKCFCHIHNHTEFSALDGLNKVLSEEKDGKIVTYGLPMLARKMGFPALGITDHGTIGGAVKFINECTRKAVDENGIELPPIKPIVGCLLKGQEIVTSDGVKFVEDVEVGDLVLTHKGRFRKVLRTMNRKHTGCLVTLKFAGCSRTLTVTDEHPILVRTSSNQSCSPADEYHFHSRLVKWVRADEIEAGRVGSRLGMHTYRSYACLPKLKGDNEEIDLLKYLPNQFECVNDRIKKTQKANKFEFLKDWDLPCRLNLNDDIAYLLGLFCAEGSFGRYEDGGVSGSIRFSLGSHELHLADRIAQIVDTEFGLETSIQDRSERGSIEVYFSSLPLAYMLETICGSGAENKRVPHEIMTSLPSIRKAFLDGVLDGDGKQVGQRTLKVISKSLAWGVRHLLVDLGHWATVAEVHEENRRVAYAVPYSPDRKYARTIEDGALVFKPISSVTKSQAEVEVFNFEVEEDNSYVSDCIMHNCEFYLSKDRRARSKAEQPDEKAGNRHILLLAKNWVGYQNLCRLSQESWHNVYHKAARIDIEMLAKYHEGIILSSACLSSVINANLLRDRYDQAKKSLSIFKDIFKEDLFLEAMYHGIDEEAQIIPDILKLSKEMNVPVIATNDVHYSCKEAGRSHEVMLAMNTGNCITNPDRLNFPYDEFYLKNAQEMAVHFGSHPELLLNTMMVAERVDTQNIISQMKSGMRLPRYSIPEGFKSPQDYLESVAFEGLKKIPWGQTPEHTERLKMELEDIRIAWENNKYDFATYMLIVRDYIQEAKNRGVLTGCGRGSGYGSVLLRALGIAYGPDPLKYGLLWERFLGFDDKYFVQESDFGIDAQALYDLRTEDEDDIDMEDLFGENRDVEDDLGGVDRY